MFIRCLNAKQGFLSFFVFQGGKLQVKSPPNGHLKNVKTFFNIRFWIITGTLIEKKIMLVLAFSYSSTVNIDLHKKSNGKLLFQYNIGKHFFV